MSKASELAKTLELDKEETGMLADLFTAEEVARDVFGTANDEAILGCHDFALCWEDAKAQAQTIAELKKSVHIARDLFATQTPTPSQVFGIYARMFADEDE